MTMRFKSFVLGSAVIAALLALWVAALAAGGAAQATPHDAVYLAHGVSVADADEWSPCKSLTAPLPTHKNCGRIQSSSPLGSRSRAGSDKDHAAADAPAVSALAIVHDRRARTVAPSDDVTRKVRSARAPFWTVFAAAMRLRN